MNGELRLKMVLGKNGQGRKTGEEVPGEERSYGLAVPVQGVFLGWKKLTLG